MRIVEITDQNRRDFTAVYECESCGAREQGRGYDDDHFHREVVPKKECGRCGAVAPASFRPLSPRYSDGTTV